MKKSLSYGFLGLSMISLYGDRSSLTTPYTLAPSSLEARCSESNASEENPMGLNPLLLLILGLPVVLHDQHRRKAEQEYS